MEICDGMTVTLNGKPYRVTVDARSCGGTRHQHPEAHATEVPGVDVIWKRDTNQRWVPHHHHTPLCDEIPRQLTLTPAWETRQRHACDMSEGGRCTCGAWREEIQPVKRKPGKVLYRYHKLADENHPDGWSYERFEEEA